MRTSIIRSIIGTLLYLLFNITLVSATDDVRLEGVVYDSHNPSQSLAVLNGEPLPAGSKILNYIIVEVREASVLLENQDTSEVVTLKLANKPKPKPNTNQTENTNQMQTKTELPEDATWSDKAKALITDLKSKPKEVANRAYELQALFHLATINNASVNYYNKYQFFPKHFLQLTQEGLLNADYTPESANDLKKGKYKFYFDPYWNPNEIGIHADPIESNSGLHYFYVGVDAMIRESLGKPADKNSRLHKYPVKS